MPALLSAHAPDALHLEQSDTVPATMDALRQQAQDLEAAHRQMHSAKLERWTAEKPFLKDTIAGLSQVLC